MAAYVKQSIGLGTVPNDDTGDDLRAGGDKINDNFDEIFGAITFEAGGTNALTFNALNEMVPTNPFDASLVGVRLGGSGAANLLDDYEEGTFPVALVAGTSGTITLTSTINTLSYTKIGNLVHIRGLVRVLSVSSPVGTLRMTGLPFVSANLSELSERSGFYIHPLGLSSALNVLQGEVFVSSTEVAIAEFDGTTQLDDVANHMIASTDLSFDFSYPAV